MKTLASTQSDQSLRCPHEGTLVPWLPIERTAKTLIKWVDAQADLSLRWTYRSFCWFCHAAAVCVSDRSQLVKFIQLAKICHNSSSNMLKKIADILILIRASPRDCQMSFVIGRGFANVQIRKM